MTAAHTRRTSPAEGARFMASYAKRYSAGAFAMPTRKDIEKMQGKGEWFESDGVYAAHKRLSRPSIRRDYTGREYTLPANTTVITHLAAEPDAALPDLGWADTVYSYIEDSNVTEQLRLQGRRTKAMRVSAASELIGAWGAVGGYDGWSYGPDETATIVRVGPENGEVAPPSIKRQILGEIDGLTGWLDDFPFYSDGSWSALSLRGFKPSDPQWGIKPSEMSKAWWAEHPDAAQYRNCDWTVLADRCPATTKFVQWLFGGRQLERVRLLQMAGRGGKGGKLSRHTDVTDKAAGVRDGKIARFHIPLITDPRITMSGWNLDGRSAQVHLEPWKVWYLDARKPHAVSNPTGVDRIHLVVDVVSDAPVREMIAGGAEYVL